MQMFFLLLSTFQDIKGVHYMYILCYFVELVFGVKINTLMQLLYLYTYDLYMYNTRGES